MEIIEYYEHDELLPFYRQRGISELPEYASTPLFSYVIMKDKNTLVGAVTCTKDEGIYIVEAIAVNEEYTGQKIGSQLLKKALTRLGEMGAKTAVLNTKNTSFFEKNGFQVVDRSHAPSSEYQYCVGCPDYGVNCLPKIMEIQIRR